MSDIDTLSDRDRVRLTAAAAFAGLLPPYVEAVYVSQEAEDVVLHFGVEAEGGSAGDTVDDAVEEMMEEFWVLAEAPFPTVEHRMVITPDVGAWRQAGYTPVFSAKPRSLPAPAAPEEQAGTDELHATRAARAKASVPLDVLSRPMTFRLEDLRREVDTTALDAAVLTALDASVELVSQDLRALYVAQDGGVTALHFALDADSDTAVVDAFEIVRRYNTLLPKKAELTVHGHRHVRPALQTWSPLGWRAVFDRA